MEVRSESDLERPVEPADRTGSAPIARLDSAVTGASIGRNCQQPIRKVRIWAKKRGRDLQQPETRTRPSSCCRRVGGFTKRVSGVVVGAAAELVSSEWRSRGIARAF